MLNLEKDWLPFLLQNAILKLLFSFLSMFFAESRMSRLKVLLATANASKEEGSTCTQAGSGYIEDIEEANAQALMAAETAEELGKNAKDASVASTY